MPVIIRTAADFYERHPISAQMILTKLEGQRGNIVGVQPEDLWPFDQDHYGGLEANDALAAAAELRSGQKVVDLCAGLGGPARYYAVKYGVDVTGIDITPPRVAGAEELTTLVGLQKRVRVLQGDVMAIPLRDESQDVVLSQEAFLHVPDLSKTFAEAQRILKPGGMFAFTNWTAPRPLSDPDKKLLWDGMAVQKLYSRAEQEAMLRNAGFENVSGEDVSNWWRDILVERMAMYQKLRGEAQQAAAPSGHDAFYDSYVLFVDLIKTGGLGGVRLAAHKPV
jgi:sarcosine/dimethylglycine N-methyltransferase